MGDQNKQKADTLELWPERVSENGPEMYREVTEVKNWLSPLVPSQRAWNTAVFLLVRQQSEWLSSKAMF